MYNYSHHYRQVGLNAILISLEGPYSIFQADVETQNQLKETIISKMHGYNLEFHDSMHSGMEVVSPTTFKATHSKTSFHV